MTEVDHKKQFWVDLKKSGWPRKYNAAIKMPLRSVGDMMLDHQNPDYVPWDTETWWSNPSYKPPGSIDPDK